MFHVALKLNKANAILSKLRPVLGLKTLRSVYYAILHCFGRKTLIQFIQLHLLQKNPSECSFKAEISTQVLYFRSPIFLSTLKRQPLKNAFLLENLWQGYILLFSIAVSSFLLSHTLMILDDQISVILTYPFFKLKPIVDI